MFEFGDIDDDSHKNQDILDKNSRKISSKTKCDYKKTTSMPEFQDEEKTNGKRASKLRESSFNRNEEKTSSEDENNSAELEQTLEDDDEDEEDVFGSKISNTLSGFASASSAQSGINNGISLDDEEDFLPKITHSKISNSKF